MAWVRLEDRFYEHPKFAGLRGEAIAMWVVGLAYCNGNRTDGRISSAIVRRLVDVDDWKASACSLVDAGLWTVEGQYYVYHDYADYQRLRDEIEQVAQAKSRAGAKGNEVRWHTDRRPVAQCDGDAMDVRCASESHSDRRSIAEASPKPKPNTNKDKGSSPVQVDGAAAGSIHADAANHCIATWTAKGFTRSQVEEALSTASQRMSEGKKIRNLAAYVGTILQQGSEDATPPDPDEDPRRDEVKVPPEWLAEHRRIRAANAEAARIEREARTGGTHSE